MTSSPVRQLLDSDLRLTLIQAIEHNKTEILRMDHIGERAAAAHLREQNRDYHAVLKTLPR